MAYANLEDIKGELGISSTETADDTKLRNRLEQASEAIDTHCSRWFEARTQTRYFERDALDHDGYTLIMDTDLISVTTLTNGDSDGTTIASTEYWLVDRNSGPPYYGIRLKSASTSSWEWDTDGWVSVAGSWGWSKTPPEDITRACIRWAAFMYHQKDNPVYETTAFPESGVITTPKGIPVDVELLLDPYVRKAG